MSLNLVRDVYKRRFQQSGPQSSWLQLSSLIEQNKVLSQAAPRTFGHLPVHIMPKFLARAHTICSNLRSFPKNYGHENRPIDTVALLSSFPCSSTGDDANNEHEVGMRLLRSRCSEPNLKKFDSIDQSFTNHFDASGTKARLKAFRNQAFLEPILSIDSPEYEPQYVDTHLRRTVSIDSAESSEFSPRFFVSTQGYFNDCNREMFPISRSQSSIADNQAYDVAYDSEVGWTKKNIRSVPFRRFTNSNDVASGKNYSRENLQLDFRDVDSSASRRFSSKSFKNDFKRNKLESIDSITEGFRHKLQLSPLHLKSGENSNRGLEDKMVFSKPNEESTSSKEKLPKDDFSKCRTSTTSNDIKYPLNDYDEETIDDVFDDLSLARSKKPLNEANKLLIKSVLNNLEGQPSKKPHEPVKKRNSSVSIKESPKPNNHKAPSKSSNIASSNVIANSNEKPLRGSLKKSSNKQQTSSDYDRDRGRSRHIDSGHRESFKKNDRTNERGSDQDRDASDREHKDGSLNRSLSNTDTNLEDRIGLNKLSLFGTMKYPTNLCFRW